MNGIRWPSVLLTCTAYVLMIIRPWKTICPLELHDENDAKCKELGIPMMVKAYGAWESEAIEAFSLLASHLATSSNRAKAEVLAALYGRLNLNLVRANATVILSRCFVRNTRVHLFILLL